MYWYIGKFPSYEVIAPYNVRYKFRVASETNTAPLNLSFGGIGGSKAVRFSYY